MEASNEAGLDAAVTLLDRGFADEFIRRRGFEIGFDFGFQGRLIALQRQQKIGFVLDDLGGDFDLTSDGVDGDEGVFELSLRGQMIRRTGMAVISLVFSGTLICANVRWALVA